MPEHMHETKDQFNIFSGSLGKFKFPNRASSEMTDQSMDLKCIYSLEYNQNGQSIYTKLCSGGFVTDKSLPST